jgi:hypothetical protein
MSNWITPAKEEGEDVSAGRKEAEKKERVARQILDQLDLLQRGRRGCGLLLGCSRRCEKEGKDQQSCVKRGGESNAENGVFVLSLCTEFFFVSLRSARIDSDFRVRKKKGRTRRE